MKRPEDVGILFYSNNPDRETRKIADRYENEELVFPCIGRYYGYKVNGFTVCCDKD
jgi:hypothetical protein